MDQEIIRIRALLARGKALARALGTAIPGHPMYAAILRDLDRVSSRALPDATGLAVSIANGLGVLAARELENGTGEAAELANVLYRLSGEIERLQAR